MIAVSCIRLRSAFIAIAQASTLMVPLLAGCGGGDDEAVVVIPTSAVPATPTSTPLSLPTPALTGDAAVEIATVQVLGTLAAVLAIGPGIPAGDGSAGNPTGPTASVHVSRATVMEAYRSARGSDEAHVGLGESPDAPCAFGGTIRASCRESGGRTLIDASLDSCTLVDEETGYHVRTSGGLYLSLERRGVCATGVVPQGITITARTPQLEQVILNEGVELLTTNFDEVTQTIESLGEGCAAMARRVTIAGNLLITNRSAGETMYLEVERLVLESQSAGAPCVRMVDVSGTFLLQSRGLDSIQRLASMRIAFGANGVSSLEIAGELATACVGAIVFHTRAPIALRNDRRCPVGGVLEVAVDDRVGSTQLTSTGGLDIDLDADGHVDWMRPVCDFGLSACLR